MTIAEILQDETPIRERSTATLKDQLAVIRAEKFWRGPYFAIDRELQDRAARRWVHDDVFGNTFAPLDAEGRMA